MGKNTYLSLPEKNRPLPERRNIILSKSLDKQNEVYIARDVNQAIELTEQRDSFVIGGYAVFESFLPLINKMEITRVHGMYDGDVHFPSVNWNEWILINEEKRSEDNINYSFLSYVRINEKIY